MYVFLMCILCSYTIFMGENVSNIVEDGSLDQPRAVFYILSGVIGFSVLETTSKAK